VIHLATRKLGDDLEIIYQADEPVAITCTRTVIGVSFPDSSNFQGYGYACVAAEQAFSGYEKDSIPERQIIIIDEADSPSASGLFLEVVNLKDRYQCQTTFCPNSPKTLADTLMRYDGLSYYSKDKIDEKEKWPHFVSLLTTCGVRDEHIESVDTMRADLDHELSRELQYPESGPVLGRNRETKRGFAILQSGDNFKTPRASQGIMQADEQILIALWLATHGLKNSQTHYVYDNTEEKRTGASGY